MGYNKNYILGKFRSNTSSSVTHILRLRYPILCSEIQDCYNNKIKIP